MAYTFKQNLVSSSKYSIKCPYSRTPKFLVIHNTYNDASAKNEVSYHNSNNNQVSFHIAVDDIEAIQCVDFGRNAWACGDGANGQGNRYGISLEICYSKSGGAKYTQAEENAVYVAARLLHQYSLGIDKLKQHADFANKNCPHRIRDEKRWDGFKGRVEWVLNEIKKGTIESSLSSGSTKQKSVSQPMSQPTQTSKAQSVKKVNGEWKVKVLVDTNLWADTNFKSVNGQVKKGEILHVTEMTEDGNFFIVNGKNLSNSHKLNYVTNTWAKPLGKIQLKQDCNAWSYANYEVSVGQIKAWSIYEYIDYKNGMYHIPYLGWVSESFVNKKLKLEDALVTN